MTALSGLPLLLTPTEVAVLLRTTRSAIYAMTERGQLPGVTRIGRRLLFNRQALLAAHAMRSRFVTRETAGQRSPPV